MLYWLEQLGVAVAAITGVLAGRGKRVDLFGVVVLALVTAFGGGTIRDLALGDTPVFWVRDGNYVLIAASTALLTFFIARIHVFSDTALAIADAVALAFFTMIGAKKALIFAAPPTVAVTMGVITGVAGGIVRDVLTGEIPFVLRQGIYLYATASICGAIVFVLLQKWSPDASLNVLIGASVTLLLRLAAIRWKLVLPSFHHREPPKA
jgi:uncharacterized membrane protein YeiH